MPIHPSGAFLVAIGRLLPPLIVLSLLSLNAAQELTLSAAAHEEKLILIKKIANRSAVFELQGGGGFYFYSAQEQIGTNYRDVSYPKPFYQIEASLAVKTAPEFPLYQGPVFSMMVVPA
ncbi:MAG: hypothetical protein JNM63_00900, partial [Spirochaetia bacterium]|nr:hypothetical protein [Spirochaetia bacterium]